MTEKKNDLANDLKSVVSDVASIASDQYKKARKQTDKYLDEHPEYRQKVDSVRSNLNENVAPRAKSVASGILNASINGMSKLKSALDDDGEHDDEDEENEDDSEHHRWEHIEFDIDDTGIEDDEEDDEPLHFEGISNEAYWKAMYDLDDTADEDVPDDTGDDSEDSEASPVDLLEVWTNHVLEDSGEIVSCKYDSDEEAEHSEWLQSMLQRGESLMDRASSYAEYTNWDDHTCLVADRASLVMMAIRYRLQGYGIGYDEDDAE